MRISLAGDVAKPKWSVKTPEQLLCRQGKAHWALALFVQEGTWGEVFSFLSTLSTALSPDKDTRAQPYCQGLGPQCTGNFPVASLGSLYKRYICIEESMFEGLCGFSRCFLTFVLSIDLWPAI